MRIITILIGLNLFYSPFTFSQNWPKIFGGQTNNWSWGLIESYDKGYIMDIQVDPGISVPQLNARLIKTDINGNQLWTKNIFSDFYQIFSLGLDNTYDGGFTIIGATTKLDSLNFDIFFMKFNSCGEKDWCSILSTPGNDDYGLKIKKIPNGYISLLSYFQDQITKRIWLMKLDQFGNIIWQICYLDTNANVWGIECEDLLVDSDNGYTITGYGWFLPQGKRTWNRRPLIIKTDSNGNQQWYLPFGQTNGFRGDLGNYPNQNQTNGFYMAARHFRDSGTSGGSPCFLKVSPSGQELYYKDLIPNSISGGSATLNLTNNDSLFITAAWTDINNTSNIGIFKSDTLGNITKTKIVAQNDIYGFNSSLFTYDNYYLALGIFQPSASNTQVDLYKFTRELEYAPLNTQPRTYDSLCPHPIVSDTTSLDDCAVVTDVQDPIKFPEKHNLIIYPNPANDNITIKMPQYLSRQSSGYGVTATTYYHQWNNTTLEIYDLFGKLMYSKEIPKKIEKVELDVSSWHAGMYLARVVFMNEVVAGAKFVVE